MPRFGTKSLLVGIALVAAWLSTFGGYEAGQDVRRTVLLLIISAAAFAAIYFRGRRQAFWIGFVVTFVLLALNQRSAREFVPTTWWARKTAENWALKTPTGPLPPNAFTPPGSRLAGRQNQVFAALDDTIWIAFALPLSAVVGFIGMCIYDHGRDSTIDNSS